MKNRFKIALVAITAVAAMAAIGVPGASAATADTVQMSGMVYTFNHTGQRLNDATILVDEIPSLSVPSNADGTYDITVPDNRNITLYAEAPGHHTIYLQTFHTSGEDLLNVNFQIPATAEYDLLTALLDVPLDASGNPKQCAIVSTFSTYDVRDLDFNGFTGYGAHGVAGGTASATPALTPAIYFNELVIPDPLQLSSSSDGGVAWVKIPPGYYRVSADHPTKHFGSFLAHCENGRAINANPTWGLYQLHTNETTNPAALAPIPDTVLSAKLKSAKVVRTGHKRFLKLKVKADERVSVKTRLFKGAKKVAARRNDYPFGPASRSISIRVSERVKAGPARLTVEFQDAAGNQRTIKRRLNIPN